MIVSTRGRYALRVMLDIAEHPSQEYIPLREIAQRQEISEKYLESILKLLVQAKLLTGLRGKGGGYRLARAPEEYTVREILLCTEGTLAPVSCLAEGETCHRAPYCRTLPMWKKLDRVVNDFFDGITLADLLLDTPDGNEYVI